MEGSARIARPNGSPGVAAVSAMLAVRRLVVAHWALLAVCALFLLVGALVLDDFGVSNDEQNQRQIGQAALDYLAGGGEQALDRVLTPFDRYYGPAFEAPLELIGRVFGQEDSRDVFLARRLLTHLFFLAGGVFCYLLAYRLFGSKPLALAALVLFLLHPRLYAHSFFNSKDIPFAAMFMIALYLTHRAFRKETLGAFLLCGVGVGVLVNLRMLGIILFAAVLALRGLDLLVAGGAGERKRILLAGGAFALAAVLTYYAAFPVLWTDPFGRFGEVWATAANHINPASNLFRGEWLYSPDGAPFEYIPVWMGITTPPAALLLAVVGVAALCRGAARRPRNLWHATPLRFNILLLLLIVGTIVAIFVGRSNIYNGWRQVYFLYAPLALLAVTGLHWLLSSTDHRWMRVGVYSLLGASVAVTLVSMARIHPSEDSYYSSFMDRTTPEYLVSRYHTDYWRLSYWPLLREAFSEHPDQKVFYSRSLGNRQGRLGEQDRERISQSSNIILNGFYSDRPVSDRNYTARIYNNTLASFRGWRLDSEIIKDITALDLSNEPIVRSDFFSIKQYENTIIFTVESCRDHRLLFHVHIHPVDPFDLFNRHASFTNWDSVFSDDVLDREGRCVVIVILPEYPVRYVQITHPEGGSVRFLVTPPEVDPAVLTSAPLASGAFDIHQDGDTLVYVRDGCADDDEEAEFLAYFFPIDPENLPDAIRRDGSDGWMATRTSFRLWDQGARIVDRCITTVPLPDWPVANVLTGQYEESGWRWRMRFAVTPPEVDEAVLAGEPLASGAFDIHRDGDALVYVRDGCTEQDAEARFLLHIYPVDAGDLPAESRAHGFENRDFGLWDHGARIDGRCLAVVPLPAYPVGGVRTGQYGETGERWSAEFFLGRADALRASLSGEPVASSVFSVYREDGALVYVREGCTEEEAGAGFFLHIVPVDVGDLPAARRQYGFDNRDFTLATRGARVDGDCVAAIGLPDYPIASIRTGQYDATGELWSVEFALPDGE